MRWLLLVLTLGLIVVHQDYWNWATTEPRAFGFLPVGLWYHALYCAAAAVLLWLFVAFAWPRHLENVQREVPGSEDASKTHGH
jgi:hypothetical protein